MAGEKIAIIGGNTLGRWIGGVGRLCIELTRLLKDKDYAITLITNRPRIIDDFPQDVNWQFLPGRIYSPSNFPLLISALKKLNPDAIHLHAQLPAIPVAILLRKILRKPVVFTPVTLTPRMASPFYHLERLISPKIMIAGASEIDHIVCQSLYSQQFFTQGGFPAEKISFAAYGLRSEYFRPVSSTLQLHENTVLSWTSGTREKGFDLLLSAIPKIVRRIEEIHFVLAHLDVERDLLRWLMTYTTRKATKMLIAKRSGLSQNYRIDGDSSTLEVPLSQLIVASDLVVHPYRTNPQEPPISLIETMALGAPTITSNIGSNTELFPQHSSSLVRPNDPEELATGIMNALNRHEEHRKLAHKLREMTLKRYDRNVALSSISKVYDSVLEND